jgi:hypothetical protein
MRFHPFRRIRPVRKSRRAQAKRPLTRERVRSDATTHGVIRKPPSSSDGQCDGEFFRAARWRGETTIGPAAGPMISPCFLDFRACRAELLEARARLVDPQSRSLGGDGRDGRAELDFGRARATARELVGAARVSAGRRRGCSRANLAGQRGDHGPAPCSPSARVGHTPGIGTLSIGPRDARRSRRRCAHDRSGDLSGGSAGRGAGDRADHRSAAARTTRLRRASRERGARAAYGTGATCGERDRARAD